MNKHQAITELTWLMIDYPGAVVVGIKMATGEVYYVARNEIEAQRWINFNADYMIPGSETFISGREITTGKNQ